MHSRPGITKAHRPRSRSFSSLLSQVGWDPDALDGLVFAYEALGLAERHSLIRAVLTDTQRPTPALAVLCAVEEDPALRRRLEGLIHRHAAVERSAWAAVSGRCGRAALIQALAGGGGETLQISWEQNEIVGLQIESELGTSRLQRLGLEPSDPVTLLDLLTPMLWRHLRSQAAVPPGLERFASFFSLG